MTTFNQCGVLQSMLRSTPQYCRRDESAKPRQMQHQSLQALVGRAGGQADVSVCVPRSWQRRFALALTCRTSRNEWT
jgi:hypothetical protein